MATRKAQYAQAVILLSLPSVSIDFVLHLQGQLWESEVLESF